MDSKKYNIQVVEGFLAEARSALAKLEYPGLCPVAFNADKIISGCIEGLEELVADMGYDVEQEEEIEDEELTVVRTMDELREYLEDNGWHVDECNIGPANDIGWELSKYSPAGEDFFFAIEHNNDVEAAVQALKQCAYNFDIDEHVQLNLGGRGAPGVTELVEDAKEIQEMLDELADGVNWCEQKTIKETLAEAAERAGSVGGSDKEQEHGLD